MGFSCNQCLIENGVGIETVGLLFCINEHTWPFLYSLYPSSLSLGKRFSMLYYYFFFVRVNFPAPGDSDLSLSNKLLKKYPNLPERQKNEKLIYNGFVYSINLPSLPSYLCV